MAGFLKFVMECLLYAIVASFHGTSEQRKMAVWGIIAVLIFGATFVFFHLCCLPNNWKLYWQTLLSSLMSLVAVFIFFGIIYLFVSM